MRHRGSPIAFAREGPKSYRLRRRRRWCGPLRTTPPDCASCWPKPRPYGGFSCRSQESKIGWWRGSSTTAASGRAARGFTPNRWPNMSWRWRWRECATSASTPRPEAGARNWARASSAPTCCVSVEAESPNRCFGCWNRLAVKSRCCAAGRVRASFSATLARSVRTLSTPPCPPPRWSWSLWPLPRRRWASSARPSWPSWHRGRG